MKIQVEAQVWLVLKCGLEWSLEVRADYQLVNKHLLVVSAVGGCL